MSERGGGQRPFGTFPKIHPFGKGNASLSETSLTELLGQPVICLLLVLKISGFECSLLK